MQQKKKGFNHVKLLLILIGAVVIVNILAVVFQKISERTGAINLCDVYIEYVFAFFVNVFSAIMSIFPFSVGEILILVGITLLLIWIVVGILFAIFKEKYNIKKCAKTYSLFMAYVITCVSIVMTLNCTLLYRASYLNVKDVPDDREYSIVELRILRNYIVDKCNEYCDKVVRDEDGYIVYDDDINQNAKQYLRNLSDVYERLDGFYPDMKPMKFSNIMTQSYICGYYFPFSFEANYNDLMYIPNLPSTFCHELAHIKGYIYEDEASFLSYLACINSEDIFFTYSGYLNVLYYVDSAYYNALSDENKEEYFEQPVIKEQVDFDNQFVLEEVFKEVEDNSIIKTEDMDSISDGFMDITLKINGVEDGKISYSRVVGLLLNYYDGVLYSE